MPFQNTQNLRKIPTQTRDNPQNVVTLTLEKRPPLKNIDFWSRCLIDAKAVSNDGARWRNSENTHFFLPWPLLPIWGAIYRIHVSPPRVDPATPSGWCLCTAIYLSFTYGTFPAICHPPFLAIWVFVFIHEGLTGPPDWLPFNGLPRSLMQSCSPWSN